MWNTQKKNIFLFGVVSFLGLVCMQVAVSLSSSGIISLLQRSVIIYSFLLGIFFLKEKVNLKEILGILVAIVGLFLVVNLKGEVTGLAVIVSLTSCFFYALQSFVLRKDSKKLDMTAMTFFRSIFILLVLGILLLILGKMELIPLEAFLILTVSQFCGATVWAVLFFRAHKYLPLSKVSLVLLLGAVFVPICAYFIFGDSLSNQKIAGMSLIVSGLAFFMYAQKRLKKKLKSSKK